MIISEIYQKLGTPPNLQEHMLRVTSVALFLAQHWNEPLDEDLLKTMLLLHDIGNIVKFNLVEHPEFLGEEVKHLDYWVKTQTEAIKKYGKDDHDATVAMLEELGISEKIRERIYGMGYWDIENVKNGNDWYLKIALYADLRVGPFGILTLQQRLDDVHTRLEKYKNRPELIEFAQDLERQVQENIDIPVSAINDENVPTEMGLLGHTVK